MFARSSSKLLISLCLGVVSVLANTSKLDSSTFRKLVMGTLAKTETSVIVYLQKKYGYDSKDIVWHMQQGTKDNSDVVVTELELESNTESESASESGEEEQEEEQSTWKKKEAATKKSDFALIEELGINQEELPKMALFRKGKMIDSLPVDTENTEPSDVASWLGGLGILVEEEGDGAEQMPQFEPLLTKFAEQAAAESSGEQTWQEIITEADALAETADDADKAKIYAKVLRSAVKNGAPKAYIAKELKRVMSMLRSSAITVEKKKEMLTKVGCLQNLHKKMEL